MSDSITLGQRMTNLDIAPQFEPYSKVIIHVSDDTVIEVGDDTGRAYEIDNPFGTQQMAQDILTRINGYQYQPYDAQGALLDPAVEIGDGATMRGVYGGIYKRSRNFGRLMKADISAPCEEEINHEYAYESPQERKFARQINDVKASLIIANDRIDASVSQTGGEQSSFGWSLTSNAHRWYANGQEVMAVTASGLSVKGQVEADTGKIGGFDITASALMYNGLNYGDTDKNYGVYIGQSGIQLGQNFRVDTAGNVSAANMTLSGQLLVGGTVVDASVLSSGAISAYQNGSYWSGGAGGGYSYSRATGAWTAQYDGWFTAKTLRAASNFIFGSTTVSWQTRQVKNSAGNTITIKYLGEQA